MKIKSRVFTILLLIFIHINSTVVQAADTVPGSEIRMSSPDGKMIFRFYQKQLKDSICRMFYTVSFKGKPVILESALDIQLDNHLSEQAMALKVDKHKDWCENLKILTIDSLSNNCNWK